MNPATEPVEHGVGEHDGVTDWGGQAAALLQSVGSRRTAGRIAMITLMLRADGRHLSAAELEERLHADGWQSDSSGIHRATATLTERGLLHTLPTPGPVAYGLAVPLHHHAICTSCGAIIEIPVDRLRIAAAEAERALRPFRFQPDPDGLAIHGRCHSCVSARR